MERPTIVTKVNHRVFPLYMMLFQIKISMIKKEPVSNLGSGLALNPNANMLQNMMLVFWRILKGFKLLWIFFFYFSHYIVFRVVSLSMCPKVFLISSEIPFLWTLGNLVRHVVSIFLPVSYNSVYVL